MFFRVDTHQALFLHAPPVQASVVTSYLEQGVEGEEGDQASVK